MLQQQQQEQPVKYFGLWSSAPLDGANGSQLGVLKHTSLDLCLAR